MKRLPLIFAALPVAILIGCPASDSDSGASGASGAGGSAPECDSIADCMPASHYVGTWTCGSAEPHTIVVVEDSGRIMLDTPENHFVGCVSCQGTFYLDNTPDSASDGAYCNGLLDDKSDGRPRFDATFAPHASNENCVEMGLAHAEANCER